MLNTLPAEVATRDASVRFAFGKNWRRFLTLVDEDRVRQAERSIRELLGVSDLAGRSFLDVGSGSGLFSLAAHRLGARVHSFDYDADSVSCTAELRRYYGGNDTDWSVERGSILDMNYVQSLGMFDVVYSWGVLHHTGAMWNALEHTGAAVAPGGTLAIAIYNDQGNWSDRWRAVKRLYCSGALGRTIVCSSCIPAFALRSLISDLIGMRNPVARYSEYRHQRGMSVFHDWIDWLGGYPFEVARPEEIFDYFRDRGFDLRRLKTCRGTVGCNEYVFQRRDAADALDGDPRHGIQCSSG
jgi:2-polyprenyl-6-hydroxyphenyl methylase/3-demethylubiquinone-9 3-methyltransferase